MKRQLAVVALLALTLAAAADGGGSKAPGTVSSSRLVDHGHIRITATVGTRVQVGHVLDLTFRIRNVSKVTRTVRLAYGSLYYVVRNRNGVQFDTRLVWRGLGGPYVPPTRLRPGEEVTGGTYLERGRWNGPLRITPGWTDSPLPSLPVQVEAAGAPASSRLAVAQVVAASGRLLDHCSPRASGVPVAGWIDAPHHSAPAMATRCSITIRRETGFDVAQVLITTPRTRRARVNGTYETVRLLGSRRGNSEAIAWQFVVTKNGATSVAASAVYETRQAGKMAPDWEWTSAGPGSRPGGSHCGGSGESGGGYEGPGVEFVSICR